MRHIQRRYAIAFEILLSFQAVANTIVFVEYADFIFTLFAARTTSCFLFDFFFIVYLIRAQKLTCLELKTYLHKVYDIIFGSFKKIIKKKRYEYMKFKNKKLNTITVFDLKDQEGWPINTF
jgi:hypothetical protein